MGDRELGWRYRVDRDLWSAERVDISLVRERRRRWLGRLIPGRRDGSAIYARRFGPRTESEQLERYAEVLEQIARHLEEGTMGCFVDTRAVDGRVEVRLFERWFDGEKLHCEELAYSAFEATGVAALSASAEFAAELKAWGIKRDRWREEEEERRELGDLEHEIAVAVRREQIAAHQREAELLARIVRSAIGP